MVLCLMITSAVLISESLQRLETDEYGLMYDFAAKDLKSEVETEGLHNGAPGFKFVKFKSTFSTIEIPKDLDLTVAIDDLSPGYFCISKDGLIVTVQVKFQYRPQKEHLYDIAKLYRNSHRYKRAIVSAGLSAINHGCGDFEIDSYQRDRAGVQARMFDYLKAKLEGNTSAVALGYEENRLWAEAVDLSLSHLTIPIRYQEVVDAKQSAELDIELARNERDQKLTEASTLLASEETAASVALLQAREEATVIIKNSEYRANATLLEFHTEGQTYKAVKDQLNFSTSGFISYLGIRAVENSNNSKVSAIHPVVTSFKDEL